MNQPTELKDIEVTTGFGANTNLPYVQLLSHPADWMLQILPNEARDLAHNLLRAAEAAEQDGFMVTFLRDNVQLELPEAVQILGEFRAYREQYEPPTGAAGAMADE